MHKVAERADVRPHRYAYPDVDGGHDDEASVENSDYGDADPDGDFHFGNGEEPLVEEEDGYLGEADGPGVCDACGEELDSNSH